MAKYRQVYTEFWSDSFVLELTPEEKYFYLYLISNSKSTQCGIYEISKRTIETDSGYNRETVEKLIQRFCDYKKILYCDGTKEIMIINWIKYNLPNNQNAIKCVQKELLKVKNKAFVKVLFDKCIDCGLNVDKIFENYKSEENCKIILKNTENIDQGANKSLSKNFEGACKGLPSNREEVISKKQEVISNKEVEEVISKIEIEEAKNKTEEIIKDKNNSDAAAEGLKNIIKIFEENVHAITPVEYEKILEFTHHVASEVIIMANEEAVSYDAKNIKYITKILSSWISLGIKTGEEVKNYQNKWERKKACSSQNQNVKTGGFSDYDGQRTYDFDELEKRLLGYVDNDDLE